jgi:hypothetical protein
MVIYGYGHQCPVCVSGKIRAIGTPRQKVWLTCPKCKGTGCIPGAINLTSATNSSYTIRIGNVASTS